MLNLHKNHGNLVSIAAVVFAGLSTIIAIVPAYQMQATQPLPEMQPMSVQARNGLNIYVSENCMACHTQQVRNIEMDNVWGKRPSMASDYYYSKMRQDIWRQSPSLPGSERTGPDLTNAGNRQPGREWHLLHLYNPRIVVNESIMPGYPWLFEEKHENDLNENDIVLPVPERFIRDKSKKIVATQSAIELVAYLQSLKQITIADGGGKKDFIPFSKGKAQAKDEPVTNLPDGKKLYLSTCAACHQADGKGLPGAFPSLAGSPIVNGENPELLLKIILKGYDARSEYGVMPGFAEQLSDDEIAAIVNHERSNWGNNAPPVSSDEVQKIRAFMNVLNQ